MAKAMAGFISGIVAFASVGGPATARHGTSQTIRKKFAWCVDPDDVQVAEVDALPVFPVVTRAALGPDVAWMRCMDERFLLV